MFEFFKRKRIKNIESKDADELISIVNLIRDHVNGESEFIFSYFKDYSSFEKEMEEIIHELKQLKFEPLVSLGVHFAPTSAFQELSLQNNWSDDYIAIASIFDSIESKYR